MKNLLITFILITLSLGSISQCTENEIDIESPNVDLTFDFYAETDDSGNPTYTFTILATTIETVCIADGCYTIFISAADDWIIDGEMGNGAFHGLQINETEGCIDSSAVNYDSNANCDDGSCTYCACGFNTLDDAGECVVQPSVCSGPHMSFDNIFKTCEFDDTNICGLGTVWDATLQQCVVTELEGDQFCGEGTIWDEVLEECVNDGGNDCSIACASGTVWDATLEMCIPIPIDGSTFCGAGTMWDATLEECIPIPTDCSTVCGSGTVWNSTLQQCVSDGSGNPGGSNDCPEDIDGSGGITILDLTAVLGAFGNTCPTN